MTGFEIILILLLFAALAVLGFLQTRASREREAMMRKYESEKDVLQEQLARASAEKAALSGKLDLSAEYERKLRESQAEQHKMELEQMKLEFERMSNKTSEVLNLKSSQSIADILKPVQERLKEFTESVQNSQKDSLARHSKLEQKIEDLDKRSQSVGDEARNLANALTGYSKIQGDFGEMLLTDVLKNAGLTEGVHFLTQGVMTDSSGREIRSENGRAMIPDVMVFYPDDTVVIVDSKLSLTAYSKYMVAETVEERMSFAKAHVESVKSHVNELKDKNYASYLPEGKRKVSYNIMFIPIEGAFRLMLEEDPRLWQVAKDNNVLIVSQMTLIIVLNMIQMSWKQHDQEKNINEVYATVAELMSQIDAWLSSYEDLGKSLSKAGEDFNKSKLKLMESNQSVIRKIKKLERLGAAPKKSREKIRSTSRLMGPQSVIPQSLDIQDENSIE